MPNSPVRVAEVKQELGEARRAGAQVRNRARQLRQDHARAVRVHAGDEGAAPGGAARLGVVVHEHAAFGGEPVDVRRFPDHQAAVITARLHPADVVAHDEQDVGLFVRLACSASGRLPFLLRRFLGQQQGANFILAAHATVVLRQVPSLLHRNSYLARRRRRSHAQRAQRAVGGPIPQASAKYQYRQ